MLSSAGSFNDLLISALQFILSMDVNRVLFFGLGKTPELVSIY